MAQQKENNLLLAISNNGKGIHPLPQLMTNCIAKLKTLKHTHILITSFLPFKIQKL
jgi:hypothetical protein